jgi:TolA-binding protein
MDYDSAEEIGDVLYEVSQKFNPQHSIRTNAPNLVATLALTTGDTVRADSICHEYLDEMPKGNEGPKPVQQARFLMMLAESMIEKDKFPEAEKLLERVLTVYPPEGTEADASDRELAIILTTADVRSG